MTRKKFGHIEIPLQRIHIELTNVCDFNCVFCPKAEMKRTYGYMDPELAKRIITDIRDAGAAEKITFHVMGEPTLHPQFFDILSHAGACGMKVGLTTNGGGLGGRAGERLLEYDLSQIDVSLQTPDERSFKLRKARGLEFDSYLEGILGFFKAYTAKKRDTIFKFRFLNTRFASRELDEKHGEIRVISSTAELRSTFRFWASRIYEILGVGEEDRQKAFAGIDDLSAYKWNVVEIYPNIFFETYVLEGWGNAFDETPVREAWGGYCFGMRDHFAILWNGDVTLCCIDFDGRTAIGNLKESSLQEILSSDRLGEIIEGFKNYRLVHPYCKRCLGSRSLVSWLFKPIASVVALKTLKPFFYKKTRLL